MKSEPINSLNSDVLYSEINNIAILTLNRPEKLNAYNVNIFNGLKEGIKKIENNENINAIIITGAGRGFCAGADMEGLKKTTKSNNKITPENDIDEKLTNEIIGPKFLSLCP